jgi:N-acetylglucosaminyldiphosphoundecaprenol N-acetyl-beta-D-mannosaminyltransferase
MRQIDFFGLKIADITIDEVFVKIDALLKKQTFSWLVTLNPEILVSAQKIPGLLQYLKKAELILADGIGIVIGCWLLQKIKLAKIAGIDLVEQMLAKEKYTFYLVGSTEKVMMKMVQIIEHKYPGSKLKGYHHGYYDLAQEKKILVDIKEKKPDIILVGLGFPNQDLFLKKLKALGPEHGIGVGVGGSFDVLTGEKKRAPELWQKMGLEWLYRAFKEPKRIVRWYFLQIYLAYIAKQWFSSFYGRFLGKKE